jgi:ABC-type transport system involved in cytochrome c biogenesis permease component
MNKVLFVGRHVFFSMLFNFFTLSFIVTGNDLPYFVAILNLTLTPLILLCLTEVLFKEDFTSGSLAVLMTSFHPYHIVLSKYLALATTAFLCICTTLPIVAFFYGASVQLTFSIMLAQFFLVLQSTSLAVLISAMQIYFKGNINFLIALMMPFLIPTIIISGAILQNLDINLIYIALGQILVAVPLSLLFSSYLLRSLYNF